MCVGAYLEHGGWGALELCFRQAWLEVKQCLRMSGGTWNTAALAIVVQPGGHTLSRHTLAHNATHAHIRSIVQSAWLGAKLAVTPPQHVAVVLHASSSTEWRH